MSGQLPGPAALLSSQRTLVLIKQQTVWAPGSVDTVPEKRSVFFPFPEFKLRPRLAPGQILYLLSYRNSYYSIWSNWEKQFMALAVVRQLLSAEARFQSQPGHCGIFGGQSGTVTHFSTSNSIFPRPYSSTNAPYLFIYHHLLAVDGGPR